MADKSKISLFTNADSDSIDEQLKKIRRGRGDAPLTSKWRRDPYRGLTYQTDRKAVNATQNQDVQQRPAVLLTQAPKPKLYKTDAVTLTIDERGKRERRRAGLRKLLDAAGNDDDILIAALEVGSDAFFSYIDLPDKIDDGIAQHIAAQLRLPAEWLDRNDEVPDNVKIFLLRPEHEIKALMALKEQGRDISYAWTQDSEQNHMTTDIDNQAQAEEVDFALQPTEPVVMAADDFRQECPFDDEPDVVPAKIVDERQQDLVLPVASDENDRDFFADLDKIKAQKSTGEKLEGDFFVEPAVAQAESSAVTAADQQPVVADVVEPVAPAVVVAAAPAEVAPVPVVETAAATADVEPAAVVATPAVTPAEAAKAVKPAKKYIIPKNPVKNESLDKASCTLFDLYTTLPGFDKALQKIIKAYHNDSVICGILSAKKNVGQSTIGKITRAVGLSIDEIAECAPDFERIAQIIEAKTKYNPRALTNLTPGAKKGTKRKNKEDAMSASATPTAPAQQIVEQVKPVEAQQQVTQPATISPPPAPAAVSIEIESAKTVANVLHAQIISGIESGSLTMADIVGLLSNVVQKNSIPK